MADKLRDRLANALGYDVAKRSKQMLLASHLRALLPKLRIDLVIDVGANVGQYGVLLRRLGYEGEILSFEPLPDAYRELERRCSADGSWHCVQCAVSDTAGTAVLNVSRRSVFSSLHGPSEFGRDHYWERMEIVDRIEVRTERLDELLAERASDLSARRILLKMDTQGHDGQVIEGAPEVLSLADALHTELSVAGIYEGTEDYLEAITRYREEGFELTGLYPSGHHPDSGVIVELDCVMARIPAGRSA